jgi:hypothetical protein
VEVIEKKRRERKKERKEKKRVCKSLKDRRLEWERRGGSVKFVRDVDEGIGVRAGSRSAGSEDILSRLHQNLALRRGDLDEAQAW